MSAYNRIMKCRLRTSFEIYWKRDRLQTEAIIFRVRCGVNDTWDYRHCVMKTQEIRMIEIDLKGSIPTAYQFSSWCQFRLMSLITEWPVTIPATLTMAQTACLRRVSSFLSSGLCFEHCWAYYGQVQFQAVNSTWPPRYDFVPYYY